MFYMRKKNKTSTTKNSKEGIITGIHIQLLKGEKPKIWEDRIVLIKPTTVWTTSLQNTLGIEADNKRERAVLTMYLCFLSATSFCSKVYVHEV